MPASRDPRVVVVDDEDQSAFADAIREHGVDAVSVAPDDLRSDVLVRATAVLVDQYLDDWPGRDNIDLPVTLHVPDGLALAAVLRSHVEGSSRRSGRPSAPVAFSLRTGDLDHIGVGLPRAAREHLLASQYNLEWVFDKAAIPGAGLPSPAARAAALARATAELPTDWGPETNDPGLRWLALPDAAWVEDARWQIEQCRPPQHTVAERTAGRAWLRWFLHRILPFPTFLLDRSRVAVALGLHAEALNEVLSSDSSPFAQRLADLRYTGPLDTFLGERWWRAGVSHMVTELLNDPDGDLADAPTVAEAVGDLHRAHLAAVDIEHPVLRIRVDYSTIPDAVDIKDAVRLQPDSWPPYADDAWAARDDLHDPDHDPELLALVVREDRWRLQGSYQDDKHETAGDGEANAR